MNAGTSASVSVSAVPVNSFSSSISVQVTGLPIGVQASPTTFTLVVGTPQQVTFTAVASAPTTSSTITFVGTADIGTHKAALSLTVNGTSSGLPVRTRYVRTDAATEYFAWLNEHWIVYHTSTARYFVTDPSSNRVIVVDGASEMTISSIGVPGAYGIDQTPDHTMLYVGTIIGDVYAVDPVGMTVTQRYPASEIGPHGFFAYAALPLADGRLALIGGATAPGPFDGAPNIALWNPTNNSLTLWGGDDDSITGFMLSADRTQIIFGDSGLREMNASTGAVVSTSEGGLFADSLYDILVTPDGKYIVMTTELLTQGNPSVADVFDAQTLALVSQFDIASGGTLSISPDSTTLFLSSAAYQYIYAYDLATQQLIGWAPQMDVQSISGGTSFTSPSSPYLLATDGTGLYVGPMEEGIGFVDLSALQTGQLGTQFTNGYLNPATGPVSGGTATKWSDPNAVGSLMGIYFGSQQSLTISEGAGYIYATTPPGQAGPVDVYAFTFDGGMQLLPEAFSYGPTILEVTPNMATAEGGGTGLIYGYGFGPLYSDAIPSDLVVTVNGIAAQVTGFAWNAYGVTPPFPLQGLAYTIPPGVSGTTVNVRVTSSAGGATASNALAYLPATQQFALAGSTLVQGIYDPYTDLYYFTDTSQVQVFSRTEGKWLPPISIPAPAGATQRLWGIALSPNGSMMAIADTSAGAIYVLNPASPTSVQTFVVIAQLGSAAVPCGVSVNDSGMVYFATVASGIVGGYGLPSQFFGLNTNTGQIIAYEEGPNEPSDVYLRTLISPDNSEVFFNDDGQLFSIDTSTNQMYAPYYRNCCANYELALSSNQMQLTAGFYIYDYDLNQESYYAMNDRENLNILYVYGAKMSPDGRLIFQPSTNGIDVFANGFGNLQDRVSLPVALSPNYDALVDDGTDNVLVAITGTGNGITVVDLTSISEPLPLQNERRLGLPRERHARPSDERHQAVRIVREVPYLTTDHLNGGVRSKLRIEPLR